LTARPLHKPWWLPADDWHQLLALHGGAPRCSVCGTTENLSVDHIQPRHYGGSHDLSNLDFKCVRHNSQKGVNDDRYWSQPFYWDQVPDLSKFRTAQQNAHSALTLDPQVSAWFAQPASQIAGKLYLLAWIVGAGKTLAIPAVALAYNHAQSRSWGAVRRADVPLVLTKEQNVRDQLAVDLANDIVRYGILPNPPRVGRLDDYGWLDDERWLRHNDIIVACVQMFWGKNGEAKRNVVEALGKFSLIFIDEPHFGHGRVQQILQAAPRSVVIGLTGSPIRRNTSLLRDYVLLSSFTYQNAHEYDRSVKHLDPVKSVHCVRLDSADVLASGRERTITSAGDPDYDGSSLVTAQQAASYVIRLMQELDVELPGRPAPHRDSGVTADLLYPAHAMISVPSRAMANMLQKQIQAHFDSDRRHFPKAAGWNAKSIFLGDGDLAGDHLDPERHPWLRAYKKGIDEETIRYTCDSHCARILIVVGMAREGVNNPLCCITASVDSEASVVEAVQRWIGRALRAVTHIDLNGELHVAPDRLDTVHFVYHEANEPTRTAADSGIHWVLNMDRYLEGLPTIGDLMDDKAPLVELDPQTANDPLTASDKVSIAVEAMDIGGDDWRADDDSVEQIVKTLIGKYAPGNPDKAKLLQEWVADTLRESPEEAFHATGHLLDDELPSIPVVMDEREKHDPRLEVLKEWARRMHPELVAWIPGMTEGTGMYEAVLAMYREWGDRGILPQVQPDISLERIRQGFTSDVMAFLKNYVPDRPAAKTAAHKYVGTAVRIVLNVPDDETAGKGTRWECPQVHTVLQRPDVKRAILGWARARLIKNGYCPDVARAFGVQSDG